jgi:alpha-glucosidase
VKVDFFDHEHKEVIDLYHTLLREGAENRILFDFHGANKPAGESRTWPNELVREAVRGMEASKMKERARHDTTLPFTRYVVGPAEYTPVHFGERRGDTTWAHQIASAAVFAAPLLTYGAHPQKMLDNPARDMIRSISSTWDETIVLPPSAIGELAVMARRKGNTWFLAAINGPTGRTVRVPLTFLGKGPRRALIVNDHPSDSAAVRVERDAPAKASDTLTLKLRPGGGFIARFDAGAK